MKKRQGPNERISGQNFKREKERKRKKLRNLHIKKSKQSKKNAVGKKLFEKKIEQEEKIKKE